MADYKGSSAKMQMMDFELPSCPGAKIHCPNRLGYGVRIDIRRASYKVHVEVINGEEKVIQTIDPAAAEREILISTLLHPQTYHNLTDSDRPITFTRWWIENEMDENDALFLGAQLMNVMGEDLGVAEDTSAEGEEEEEPKKPSGRKGKTRSEPTPEEEE